MSGLETAAAVYGLIGGTIDIIKTSLEIYEAVKDKSGIPEKLRKVSDKLPSLLEILKSAKAQYRAGKLDQKVWVNAAADVERCKEACRDLQSLLQSAYPKADASKVGRFFKATGTVLSSRGKTAEQLLGDIYECLKLLVDRQILTQSTTLDDIKKTIDGLKSQPGLTQNNQNGPNIGGDQNNYNNSGSGHMFTGAGGTFNFGGT